MNQKQPSSTVPFLVGITLLAIIACVIPDPAPAGGPAPDYVERAEYQELKGIIASASRDSLNAMARDGSDAQATATRLALDVPSNASSVASLSAHTNAANAVHGAPADTRLLTASETINDAQIPAGVARDTEIPNNASFTYNGLGGFATPGTNGIPANASFTLAGLAAKPFSSLTGIPTTIAGYGLTDAASVTAVQAAQSTADNHIASTGTAVHGLGTIATQNANAVTLSGTFRRPATYMFFGYASATNQAVASGVYVPIHFVESYDNSNAFDNIGTYTAPVTGYYRVTANLQYSTSLDNTQQIFCRIFKNGVASDLLAKQAGTGGPVGVGGSTIMALTAGDRLYICAYISTDTSSRNVQGGSAAKESYFSVEYVGE